MKRAEFLIILNKDFFDQPPKRCSRKSGGKRNLSEELGGSSEDDIGGAKAFSCDDGFGAAKAGGTIRRKKAVGNTQSKSFFHDFAVQKCIYKLLSNHETCGINLDQVVCLGHQFDDGVFYLGLSTFSMVCNVFRGIASGWDFTYMGDGALKLFDEKMYAIFANANELRNVTSWIAMAFVLRVL